MKILYISQHFPPETGAAQARAYDMAKNLVRLGNRVTVITGFPNFPTGIIPKEFRKKLFKKEFIDNIEVIRTFLIPDTKSSSMRRLANYFSFMISSIFGGFSFKKYDIVYATSPQLFVGLSGFILSKLHRAKFVFEVRDLWVDFAEALNQIKNRRLLKLGKNLERFLYKKADLIITVTKGYKEHLVAQGVGNDKIDVVTNGVDIDFYKPSNKNVRELRDQYNLMGKFVVLFAGNIGAAQGLDVVIDAAENLQNYKDIKFLFVGEGVKKENLKEKAEKMGLSNIIFEDAKPKSKIVDYHNMADVTLVSLKKFELFNITLPSKTFDALAIGKPVLIGVDGEAREIIESAEAGLFFEPGNCDSLVNCVLKLYKDKELCNKFGMNARMYAEKHFTREQLARQLNESLTRIIS
jgi:glycosyltransferase involved in cell wall biosynthesis